MPSEQLFLEFKIVGILLLAASAIALAFYKLWRELLTFIKDQDATRVNWMNEQDQKREKERDLQRTWQAEQDEIRDKRWQIFLKTMQETWMAQDGQHTKSIDQLVRNVADLIKIVEQHDQATRNAITVMQERTK